MTDKEVMQQALEALTYCEALNRDVEQQKTQAITALRTALEQPEQHPVAFVNADHLQGLTLGHYGYAEIYTDESEGRVPVYTTPPAAQPEQVDCPRCGHVCSQRPWVGLTDEDVNRESAPITSQKKLAFHAGMYVAQKILKERNNG